MKLSRIAAFPSANLISPKKWANIVWDGVFSSLKVLPVPFLFTFILLVPLSTAIFSKQCRVMTTNGYDIVNIIQMSIILMYPVIGRDWEIPMKLKQNKVLIPEFELKLQPTMLLKPKAE